MARMKPRYVDKVPKLVRQCLVLCKSLLCRQSWAGGQPRELTIGPFSLPPNLMKHQRTAPCPFKAGRCGIKPPDLI